jgi:hypothetical protein
VLCYGSVLCETVVMFVLRLLAHVAK